MHLYGTDMERTALKEYDIPAEGSKKDCRRMCNLNRELKRIQVCLCWLNRSNLITRTEKQ